MKPRRHLLGLRCALALRRPRVDQPAAQARGAIASPRRIALYHGATSQTGPHFVSSRFSAAVFPGRLKWVGPPPDCMTTAQADQQVPGGATWWSKYHGELDTANNAVLICHAYRPLPRRHTTASTSRKWAGGTKLRSVERADKLQFLWCLQQPRRFLLGTSNLGNVRPGLACRTSRCVGRLITVTGALAVPASIPPVAVVAAKRRRRAMGHQLHPDIKMLPHRRRARLSAQNIAASRSLQRGDSRRLGSSAGYFETGRDSSAASKAGADGWSAISTPVDDAMGWFDAC